MTMTVATHTLVKLRDHSVRGSKNTQTYTNQQAYGHRTLSVHGMDMVLTWESNWHKSKNKEAIYIRQPLPWTQTRDTTYLPSTAKLYHWNLSRHMWPRLVADGSKSCTFHKLCSRVNEFLQTNQTRGFLNGAYTHSE